MTYRSLICKVLRTLRMIVKSTVDFFLFPFSSFLQSQYKLFGLIWISYMDTIYLLINRTNSSRVMMFEYLQRATTVESSQKRLRCKPYRVVWRDRDKRGGRISQRPRRFWSIKPDEEKHVVRPRLNSKTIQ